MSKYANYGELYRQAMQSEAWESGMITEYRACVVISSTVQYDPHKKDQNVFREDYHSVTTLFE